MKISMKMRHRHIPENCANDMQNRITRQGLGDWDDVRVFLAVARDGSYSKAAETLGTQQSTVSRRVQALEQRLGVKLFDRYSHGMRPTPAARAVQRRAETMECEAQSIERQLIGTDVEMEGVVRVTGTEAILAFWLVRHIRGFYQQYPRIKLELISSNEQLDLGAREADVALRFGKPKEPRLVARSLGAVQMNLFASKAYARAHGLPRSVEEVRNHCILDHTGFHKSDSAETWTQFVAEHDAAILQTNSWVTYLQALELGLGIGILPRFIGTASSEYIDLDLDLRYSSDLYLVTHEETNKSARIRAFCAYLNEAAAEDKGRWFT